MPRAPHKRHGPAHKRDTKRLYNRAGWRGKGGLRERHLQEFPTCQGECRDRGLIVPAVDVDHIIPHRGDWDLFWDASNLCSLCVACHSKKTAKGE